MADKDVCVPEWIHEVESGGSIPNLEPDNCPNGWATPPGDAFMVRGPDYLSTKVKIPGGEYLLKPLGFDWIKGPSKISEVLKHPTSRVRQALDREVEKGNNPFVWAFNLQLPSRDNYSAIAYFVALEPPPDGSLIDQFVKGDEIFKKSRLKLIANVVKGPWIVRTAVGEQAICILGRAVSCKYVMGNNFIEVDIDIGASMVANAIVHLAFGYVTSLTVDLAFLIESQSTEELPERILGAVRFSELTQDSAGLYEPPSDEIDDSQQMSLPTRLFKSIGLGFSHLLHPGAQEGSTSDIGHMNGISNIHENSEDVLGKKDINKDIE